MPSLYFKGFLILQTIWLLGLNKFNSVDTDSKLRFSFITKPFTYFTYCQTFQILSEKLRQNIWLLCTQSSIYWCFSISTFGRAESSHALRFHYQFNCAELRQAALTVDCLCSAKASAACLRAGCGDVLPTKAHP